MKTRTVRVIRKIILSGHAHVEIPAEATNEALLSALRDQANCYDCMEIALGVHDMEREEDGFEIEDCTANPDHHFKMDDGNSDWGQAIEDDQVILGERKM